MAEPSMTRARRRRSTRISEELQAARRRNAEQQAPHEAREKEVDAALEGYFSTQDEIAQINAEYDKKVTVEERKYERKIEPYRRRIAEVEEQHRDRVAELENQRRDRLAGLQAAQAKAARTIRSAGRTVDEVKALLKVSRDEARRLIAAGRKAAAAAAAEKGSNSASAASVDGAASGKQDELSGVDGQENGADPGFVPAVADGGGQGA